MLDPRLIARPYWVRNVMTPLHWPTVAIVTSGLYFAANVATAKGGGLAAWVLGGVGVWLLFYMGVYVYFMIRDRQRLQSEGFLLGEKKLSMKAKDLVLDAEGIEILMNPEPPPDDKKVGG